VARDGGTGDRRPFSTVWPVSGPTSPLDTFGWWHQAHDAARNHEVHTPGTPIATHVIT
jgi:hypothetical protein